MPQLSVRALPLNVPQSMSRGRVSAGCREAPVGGRRQVDPLQPHPCPSPVRILGAARQAPDTRRLGFSFSCCLILGRAGEGHRGGPAHSSSATPVWVRVSLPGWGRGLVSVFLHPGTSRAACGQPASHGQDFQECTLLTTQARPHMPNCSEL